MKYASFFCRKNKEDAQLLFDDVVILLYEGKRTLDFTKSPLTYFQLMLKHVFYNTGKLRQASFEAGVDLSFSKKGKPTRTYTLRNFMLNLSECPSSETYSPENDAVYYSYMNKFNTWKQGLPESYQWILAQFEDGRQWPYIWEHCPYPDVEKEAFKSRVYRVRRLAKEQLQKILFQAA